MINPPASPRHRNPKRPLSTPQSSEEQNGASNRQRLSPPVDESHWQTQQISSFNFHPGSVKQSVPKRPPIPKTLSHAVSSPPPLWPIFTRPKRKLASDVTDAERPPKKQHRDDSPPPRAPD
jgi:hypothetical protein